MRPIDTESCTLGRSQVYLAGTSKSDFKYFKQFKDELVKDAPFKRQFSFCSDAKGPDSAKLAFKIHYRKEYNIGWA